MLEERRKGVNPEFSIYSVFMAFFSHHKKILCERCFPKISSPLIIDGISVCSSLLSLIRVLSLRIHFTLSRRIVDVNASRDRFIGTQRKFTWHKAGQTGEVI